MDEENKVTDAGSLGDGIDKLYSEPIEAPTPEFTLPDPEEINSPVESNESETEEPKKKAPGRKKSAAKATDTLESEADEKELYKRKTVTKVSATERKKALQSENVIAAVDDEDVVTEADEKYAEYVILSDAAKNSRKVLKGEIFGIDHTGEGNALLFMAHVRLLNSKGYYTIKITSRFLFDYDPNKYIGEKGINDLERDMIGRIGSVIDFVVYDVKLDRTEVYASRMHALNLLGYLYYTMVDPFTGKPKINDGDIVKATITTVGPYGITAEACGAEFYIPSKELEYNRVDDPREHYTVGESINVKVRNIHVEKRKLGNHTLDIVKCEASKKRAERNPIELYWNDFKEDSTYIGVIHFRNDLGYYYVNVEDKVDVICSPPNYGTPAIGQKCIIRITKKIEDEGEGDQATPRKRIIGKFITLR